MKIMPLPGMAAEMVGCIMHRGSTLSVFELARIVGQIDRTANDKRPSGQIVVITLADDRHFGLIVDELGEIVEVLANRLTPIPDVLEGQEAFADTAIAHDDTDESRLLVVLNAERLFGSLSARAGSIIAPDAKQGRLIPLARTA
jgi:chemotaxis signal transduction protein